MHYPHPQPRMWHPSNSQANANLLLLESAILQTMAFPAGPIYLDQTGFGFAVAAPGTTGAGKLWQVTGTPTSGNLPSALNGDWALDLSAQPRALWGPRLAGAWPTTPVTASSLCVAAVWYGWGTPSNTLGQEKDVFLDQMTGQWYGPRVAGGWPVSGFNPQAGATIGTVGAPDNSIGQNGMWAVDTKAGLIYSKTAGVWGPGAPLAPVAVGVYHPTTGAPVDALGNDGDWAQDSTAKMLYGPKANGTWTGAPEISLAQRPGVWFPTNGAPANTVGVQGDWAFDAAALAIYGPKGAANWPSAIPVSGPVSGVWRFTNGAPGAAFGTVGDAALDPMALKYYTKGGAGWSSGTALVQAVVGLLHGTTGVPADTVGSDGDWAFDAQANVTYGMKAGGAWPTPGLPGYAVPQGIRPSVGGSRSTATVAVLAQLLTVLAQNGQIVDNTTP